MSNPIADRLDSLSETSGRILAFTPLALIMVQFVIIIMAAVFHKGSIQLQESLQYINALMFLGGAGYTLKHNEHVRVDLFYSGFKQRTKDIVDLTGTIFLMLPFVGLIWYSGLPFALDSWSIFEGSVESSGLPYVYLLKSTIILFALSITIQALANIIRLVSRLKAGAY